MPKITVVLGLDHIGKTTMINRWIAEHDAYIDVRRLDKPYAMPTAEKQQWAIEQIIGWSKLAEDSHVVYDRFVYPDDWVYGGDGWNAYGLSKFDAMLSEYGAVFIYLEPLSKRDYLLYIADNPDEAFDLTDPQVLGPIVGRYLTFVSQTSCSVLTLYCDLYPNQEQIDFAYTFGRRETEQQILHDNWLARQQRGELDPIERLMRAAFPSNTLGGQTWMFGKN